MSEVAVAEREGVGLQRLVGHDRGGRLLKRGAAGASKRQRPDDRGSGNLRGGLLGGGGFRAGGLALAAGFFFFLGRSAATFASGCSATGAPAFTFLAFLAFGFLSPRSTRASALATWLAARVNSSRAARQPCEPSGLLFRPSWRPSWQPPALPWPGGLARRLRQLQPSPCHRSAQQRRPQPEPAPRPILSLIFSLPARESHTLASRYVPDAAFRLYSAKLRMIFGLKNHTRAPRGTRDP